MAFTDFQAYLYNSLTDALLYIYIYIYIYIVMSIQEFNHYSKILFILESFNEVLISIKTIFANCL